ncbi:MAG TPA: hypothetical protein VEY94_12265 [Patescibacteria group bacterium]|nr:hypothetical protein [Patescibacteria group bacterium]
MNSVRLKSSFIYLANAVNDLRGNWSLLAVVLAPLVLAAALCLLPAALNLQRSLATSFAPPGSQNISYMQSIGYAAADNADSPAKPPPLQEPQPYSQWILFALNQLVGLIASFVTLIVLSSLKRIQAGMREPSIVGEAITVYRDASKVVLGFIWVTVLQFVIPDATSFLVGLSSGAQLNILLYFGLLLMIVLSALVYAWLYFAQFALIFDGRHSFHALLFSRDLMRKRFFKVATRIAVFVAFLWGYTSLAYVAFFIVSKLLGPVGAVTGFLGATIFVVDFCAIGVNFAVFSLITAASLRLYQDLRETQIGVAEGVNSVERSSLQPTAQLPSAAL